MEVPNYLRVEDTRAEPIATAGLRYVPTPFRLAAYYDRLRLSIYRDRGVCGSRIAIEDRGHSTFLRFDDVGYFNTVYSQGDDIHEQLDAIEEFFRESPWGCRLFSPALGDVGALADDCRRRGWLPDEPYVWLSADCRAPASPNRRVTIRRARRDEGEMFFRIYLEAFEAAPDRMSAAVDNMRHLFAEPDLHFLLASQSQTPAGVGMLLQVGAAALLCAGAMLPAHRGLGGHEALLAARVGLAHALGCSDVHSWAIAGGRSHANMEHVGLRAVATTRAWRLLPRHRR